MDSSKCEIIPGVWLDNRKAVFLEEPRILCIADLHLGYVWAHRCAGQLMPLSPDDTAERIEALCRSWNPSRLAILGDVIHRDVASEGPRKELRSLMHRINACSRVELVAGNHDRGIEQMLGATGTKFLECGRFVLAHGDVALPIGRRHVLVIGHEHPAIGVGDGIRGARFPCFLWGPGLLIVPAFSPWAAGSDVRSRRFMSPFARERTPSHAIAIMGEKLLKIPLL